MPFAGYCTRDDVFLLGLSAQAFVVRARPVTASTDVDTSTGIPVFGYAFSGTASGAVL
jgi:hypothetical protein